MARSRILTATWLLITAGCAGTAVDGSRRVPGRLPVERQRVMPRVDSVAARERRGALSIAMRDSEYPTRPAGPGRVMLNIGTVTSATPPDTIIYTDASGIARLNAVPSGPLTLRLVTVGFLPRLLHVTVPSGCELEIEAYLSYEMTCLFECPRPPFHAVITTCPRDD